MGRTLWALSGVLALMLGWAYYLTHPPIKGPAAGEVALWDVAPRGISLVTVKTKAGTVTLRPAWPELGDTPTVWVHHAPAPAPAPKKGSVTPSPANPPTTFRGNAQTVATLSALTKLRAQRRIGSLSELDGAAFGFTGDSGYVLVERTGSDDPLRLNLGDVSVGKNQRYVHTPSDGLVFLLPEALFRPFALPKRRLLERQLLPFPPGEAGRVEIHRGGGTATLRHLDLPEGEKPRWSAKAEGDAGEAAAQAFIEALPRVSVIEYLTQGQAPQGAATLEVRLFRKTSGDAGMVTEAWMRIYKPDKQSAVAVSSFTEKPVRVSAAVLRAVLKGADEILRP